MLIDGIHARRAHLAGALSVTCLLDGYGDFGLPFRSSCSRTGVLLHAEARRAKGEGRSRS